MLDDIKKSFSAILYERTTSPLYGTLIISWAIWNWRIIYLTFFVSENKFKATKIAYIQANYADIHHLITFPLISTFLLLTIVPFIANGAYWLSLIFDKWKRDQKNIVDMKQLLSMEQSIELREELSNQEERFNKILENKNQEIRQLQLRVDGYKNSTVTRTTHVTDEDLIELSNKIKKDETTLSDYRNLIWAIQQGMNIGEVDNLSSEFISLLEGYEVIENVGKGYYEFTVPGKKLLKLMGE